MATETWEGSFYCVKCKEKRDAVERWILAGAPPEP